MPHCLVLPVPTFVFAIWMQQLLVFQIFVHVLGLNWVEGHASKMCAKFYMLWSRGVTAWPTELNITEKWFDWQRQFAVLVWWWSSVQERVQITNRGEWPKRGERGRKDLQTPQGFWDCSELVNEVYPKPGLPSLLLILCCCPLCFLTVLLSRELLSLVI